MGLVREGTDLPKTPRCRTLGYSLPRADASGDLGYSEEPTRNDGPVSRERLLTVTDCADRWSVSARTVQKWIKAGIVPSIRLGKRPLIRIALSDIEAVERAGKISRT